MIENTPPNDEPSGKVTAMRFLCAVAAFSTWLAVTNYVNENYALAELQAGYAGVMLAGALIVRLAVRS